MSENRIKLFFDTVNGGKYKKARDFVLSKYKNISTLICTYLLRENCKQITFVKSSQILGNSEKTTVNRDCFSFRRN